MRPAVITPMVTPFNPDGSISLEMTESLISNMKKFRVDGAFPMGSTGVFPWITAEERLKFLQFVAENAGGMDLYAGVASPCVEDAIDMASRSEDMGYDFAVLPPPYYIKPGDEGLREYYSKILGSVDIKFLIYNIPQFTGYYIPFKVLENLAIQNSNFVGIKDSSGDIRYHERLLRLKTRAFSLYQGQDDLFLQSVLLGSDGGVCGTTNFAPYVVEMSRLVESGKLQDATSIQSEKINPMIDALKNDDYPSTYYYAFYKSINGNGGYRTPMTRPVNSSTHKIDELLSQV